MDLSIVPEHSFCVLRGLGPVSYTHLTGTPVSNSMPELYTIQRYLQHDRLQEMGMGHFDCWASRFGETTTALALAPEGTGYRARTRFAKSVSYTHLDVYKRQMVSILQPEIPLAIFAPPK